jgi:hypothetical protein
MPLDRSIGSNGLEQGGPNLGNDYSRDISRETQEDDTLKITVPDPKKKEKEEERQREQNQQSEKK